MTDAFERQAISEVERVTTLSTAAFRQRYLHKEPVVLTGMTKGWPAVGKWTPAYLREACGDTAVIARQYLDDGRPFIAQAVRQKRRVTVRQWIDFLEGRDSGPLDGERHTWSLRESPELFRRHPALLLDARLEELFPELGGSYTPYLWFGPAGYVTGLHTDLIDVNLLLHLHGEKEMLLYAPDQGERMYPELLSVQGGMYSLVNAYAPDLKRHPGFAEAVGRRARLRPGDVIYVPRGWWHMVRSLHTTISLTASCARLPQPLSAGNAAP